MYEYKVIITNDSDEINAYLKQGWFVHSITPQHVATATTPLYGNFCFLLKK